MLITTNRQVYKITRTIDQALLKVKKSSVFFGKSVEVPTIVNMDSAKVLVKSY